MNNKNLLNAETTDTADEIQYLAIKQKGTQ